MSVRDQRCAVGVSAVCLLVTVSCQTVDTPTVAVLPPRKPSVRIVEAPRLVTFGVDAADYNRMTSDLVQAMLGDPKLVGDQPRVLALGPIDGAQCQYRFDARRFQEKLQTRLHASQRFAVSFAVDAMQEDTAAHARYNIMQLQWEKQAAVDSKDLRAFGTLADIDYLLFGRVSTTTATRGEETEVTYAFNWKVGDCRNGLLVWNGERELAKAGPRISGVFDPSRRRVPVLVCPLAFSPKSQEQYPALVAEWEAKGYGNAVWQTLEEILYDVDEIETVTIPPARVAMIRRIIESGSAAGLEQDARDVLTRFPRSILVPNLNFFESVTESFRLGRVARNTVYHVELFVRCYELDGQYLNVPIAAKGAARGQDLLAAIEAAARDAVARLLPRLSRSWHQRQL